MGKYEVLMYIGLALIDIAVFIGYGSIVGLFISGVFLVCTGFFKLIN